ncbi:unnamed protein product [Durusdinium trenchii]|uniref:26S proteasome regulatory subunit RPN10 n=1 Tax=Durusdinium trenchii TaxID=1381693 RepID=A0ABP0LK94_9DINO
MAKSAMSTTPSVLAAMSYGAIVDVKDKNSLYVSNLSVNVTENSLREVFRACGQLNEVIFRTYPGSLKWYAQLNFQSADGVVQASKMEGTPICGTALRCSAIDPTSMAAHEVLAREQAKEEAATKAQEETDAARQEWHKKLREHAEARKLRTVHIDGLPSNTTLQDLQRLGEQFGTVEQLRLDRDAKGAAFGLVQFKELGIARGCCLRRTFLVDDHVVVFSESKSEVNSMDIEEATVEFRHPCIDRALASSAGGEQSAQGKFWEELAEKRRQLYNTKLEMVRQNAEEILGPGIAASPPPSPPEEDDFYAWAKQAAAFAEDVLGAVHGEDEKPEEREEEPEEKGPVDLEEHPDIVPGTELAVLNDSSEEEISEDDEGDAVDVIGGAFADGPRARRQRRAALRAQRAPRRPKPPAAPPPTPAQWAAQRQSALERLQASPAQWAAARQRALDRLKAKRSSTAVLVRPGPGRGRQNAVELLEEIQVDLDGELAPEDLTEPKRARRAKGEDQMGVQRTGALYALWSHQKLAAAAGVASEIIKVISEGKNAREECKSLLSTEEAAALALCDELLQPGMVVSEATYSAALAVLGERRGFEVSVTAGFYLLLSAVLKTFDVRPPEDLPQMKAWWSLCLALGLLGRLVESESCTPELLRSDQHGHYYRLIKAVMICLDNSDYTRNGDYMPTRFDSQSDAANLLCGAKTNQNPENAVGILAAAGDRIEVMVTPTSDLGRLVTELNKVQIGGNADLLRAIQTAQLALKHRQNKKQKQRIIAFVGSPVSASDKELEALGKNLKKNSVALDLVSFGEVEENAPKLEKLMNALNSNDTSHLLEAPVGPKLLSDVLLASPIINPEGEAGGSGDGGAGFEFGINPNEDPELALALRISMEEERARQQDMDDELRQALLLSMQEMDPVPATSTPAASAPEEAPKRKAEEMETEKPSVEPQEKKPTTEGDAVLDSRWLQDPSFVQELLGSLPGVDINDERIQEALKEGEEETTCEKLTGGKCPIAVPALGYSCLVSCVESVASCAKLNPRKPGVNTFEDPHLCALAVCFDPWRNVGCIRAWQVNQECVVWGQSTIVLVTYVLMFDACRKKDVLNRIIVALITLILLGTCFVAARESMTRSVLTIVPFGLVVYLRAAKKMKHGTTVNLEAAGQARQLGEVGGASDVAVDKKHNEKAISQLGGVELEVKHVGCESVVRLCLVKDDCRTS